MRPTHGNPQPASSEHDVVPRGVRTPAIRALVLCSVAILLSTAMFIGCGTPSERGSASSPGGVNTLPDSTLIDVLADLHLVGAERYFTMRDDRARTATEAAPDDSSHRMIRRLTTDAPIDSLLDAHDVDRAAYDSAIEWYIDHPEEFVSLYNRVLDRLNQVQ